MGTLEDRRAKELDTLTEAVSSGRLRQVGGLVLAAVVFTLGLGGAAYIAVEVPEAGVYAPIAPVAAGVILAGLFLWISRSAKRELETPIF